MGDKLKRGAKTAEEIVCVCKCVRVCVCVCVTVEEILEILKIVFLKMECQKKGFREKYRVREKTCVNVCVCVCVCVHVDALK